MSPKPAPVNAAHDAKPPHWWALALALGTLWLFAPARDFAFVNFDDDVFVFANEHVRQGLTLEGLKWAFLSADIDYWRPLSWLSHMADVELHDLRAGGHHFTSVLFHAANAALLLLALHRLTNRAAPSLLAAALFAWHPLHVESVAWVAERKDVLCTFFWFLGLWCYAGYATEPTRRRLLTVVACLALGLMSKPMILTFPFQLLLLDVWPLRRVEFKGNWREFAARSRPLVLEKLPLFALVALAAVGTYIAQRSVGAMMAEEVHPLAARLANAPVSYARYLGLTVWPRDLAILYPMPNGSPAWQVGGALALLAAASWLAARWLSQKPWLAVGWFWFLGTLVPVIGLVQVGNQSIADRYTYVPLVGLFVALAWFLDTVRASRPAWSAGLIGAAVFALGVFAFTTRQQLQHWRDGTTIFEQAVRVTRGNYIAMTNLGNNLARTGQHQRAIELYRESLRIRPNSAETHYNLAASLSDVLAPKEAERHYREALRHHPGYAKAHNNLANLLSDSGRVPEAIQHYEECLRLSPGHLEARFNYGITLADNGKPLGAIAQFEAAVQQQPAFAKARVQLVSLYAALGKIAEAMTHNEELLRRNPASPEGHFNAGSFAVARNDWTAALQHWQAAVRAKPGFRLALHRLAWTYATHPNASVRNPKAAIEFANQFVAQGEVWTADESDLLAVAFAANGDFGAAVKHAEKALASPVPGSARPEELRARLALFQSGRPFVESQPK